MYWCLFCLFIDSVVEEARKDSSEQQRQEVTTNNQTTKDDIARLIHLFKEPVAQRHWTNHYSVLTHRELNSCKLNTKYSESANPLEFFAQIFNDYDGFQPQNLMVQYTTLSPNSRPVKKCPYVTSSSEWAYLAAFTHDVDPTNVTRRNIIRGPDWIKSTWGEVRRYLHQV